MLPFLAAAAAAVVASANPAAAREAPSEGPILRAPGSMSFVRLPQRSRCSSATRMVASFGEPALLRPQDRDAAVFSRLKDLPQATPCLVGGVAR